MDGSVSAAEAVILLVRFRDEQREARGRDRNEGTTHGTAEGVHTFSEIPDMTSASLHPKSGLKRI